MAMRENQGLQIALIIFVMLTVVLSVTTFLFFKKYDEERQKIASHIDKQNAAENELAEVRTDFNKVKAMIGYRADQKIALIQKTFDEDKLKMADLGFDMMAAADTEGNEEVADTNLNYRMAVPRLIAELDKRSGQIVASAADVIARDKQIVANRAEDKGKLDAAILVQEKAQKERDDDRKDHLAQREVFKTRMAELEGVNRTTQDDLTKKTDSSGQEIGELVKERDRLRTELREAIKIIAEFKEGGNVETPDGEITWIVARQRMVFINIGSADRLRPQTTFSIYGTDAGKLVASKRKGKIEVTRITGPHSAEARILEDFRSDPLLPGDKIHSPVWHPGRQIHFALVGEHDIDGDGDSDRAKVRDLIHINGGVIDAEMLDKPDRTRAGVSPREQWLKGQMTVNTRYLVLGKAPTDKSKGDGLIDAYSSFINEAKSHGVQTMNLQQFLDMMGYQADERTVGLGRGADPRDFRPGGRRATDGFRERRPPARDGKKGAY